MTQAELDSIKLHKSRIISKENPEWGEWKATGFDTHDGVSWFNISRCGRSGGRVAHTSELLRFWDLVCVDYETRGAN